MVIRLILLYTVVLMMACNSSVATADQVTYKNGSIVSIDSAGWPQNFGFGHTAAKTTIAAMDKDVRPDGKGLPPGKGNAETGSLLYATKCAACHGTSNQPATKLPGPPLFANPDSPQVKTIGNYWPHAT